MNATMQSNRSRSVVSLLLAILFIFSLAATVLPYAQAATVTVTENNLKQYQKDWDAHEGYVIRWKYQGKVWWASKTDSGIKLTKDIQTMLVYLGYNTAINGKVDATFDKIIRQYQKDKKLDVDGCVGPGTWKNLLDTTKKKIQSSSKTSASKTTTQTTKASASKSGYSAQKAVDYAIAHAQDGKGLCAEFVSNCIQAGGIKNAWSASCTTLQGQLSKLSGVTKTKLTVSKDGSIKSSGISKGDIIMVYCSHEDRPYVHAVIVTGFDGSNRVKVCAHNRAIKNQVYYGFSSCGYCGRSTNTAYLFHFN